MLAGFFHVMKKVKYACGFILDKNITPKSLGVRITKVPIPPTSKRVIDSIKVDGREGRLTVLNDSEDLSFTFSKPVSSMTRCFTTNTNCNH